MVPFLSSFRLVFAVSVFLVLAAPGRAAEPRVTFANSLAPLPVTTGAKLATPRVAAVSAAQLAAPLEFNVAMKMRNFEEFQTRVSNGEQVPFDEVENKYLPLPADYATVRAWLVSEGFTVTMDDARRLGVFVRGTTAQIQASFGVTMQSVTVDGVTYTAAANAPSLPASIAGGVLGVHGLQPYLKAQRHFHMEPVDIFRQTNNTPPYTVPEIRKAYDGANLSVSGTTLTGGGQKIAIIIDAYPADSDLTQFWNANGITTQSLSNIEKVNVPGGTVGTASGEESLDVEWSSSVAPASKVRIYCTDNLSTNNISRCLAQLATDVSGSNPAQPAIHALSMSLGIPETSLGKGSSLFTQQAQYFTTIANGSTANGGVSSFVSSGDGGSTPGGGYGDVSGPLTVSYEGSDPNVTCVGGTALTLNTGTGARSAESAWVDGGGGVSIQFARPAWQPASLAPANGMRLVPDVALVGSGDTPGYLVFGGSVYNVSGTSWSAPTWAGFATLINQGRTIKSRLPMGLLNPRVYPLLGTNNFTDITTGNNSSGPSAAGKYAAAAGFDECTGLGVPDVANLLVTLLGPTITGLSPNVGSAGTSVVITGTNFYNVTSVKFGTVAASSYTVNGPTQITAVAPAGVMSAPVFVTALGDAASSSSAFLVGAPDLTVTMTHADPFTYHDTGDTYTITVANGGNVATIGTVTATISFFNGTFTATNLTGTGWTAAVDHLSATRTDALAPGGSYPPLTVTVSVIGSPQGTASQVNVSGGGETNTSNDIAQDSTTIVGQTPSQAWRYQYFGTNANTGDAADTANPSGDGINNLTKYALGLNPTVPTVNPEVEDTSTGYLRLTVPKNPNATDVQYSVQVTSDLTDPASWTTNGTFPLQNNSTTLQVRDTMLVSGTPKRFIRLQVTR